MIFKGLDWISGGAGGLTGVEDEGEDDEAACANWAESSEMGSPNVVIADFCRGAWDMEGCCEDSETA